MLPPDFKELLRLFNEKSVEYLVVGGYALAAHGFPRYTGDIDLWVNIKPENVTSVLGALDEFGLSGLGLTAEDFRDSDRVIQLGYPPVRIDILTGIDGVVFDEAWPRRISVLMDSISLPVISRDDLVANKKASGRTQDLADLEKLG